MTPLDEPADSGRRDFLRRAGSSCAAAVAVALGACDVREFARTRGAKLRLSIATGPVGGGYYVYGGALAKVISAHVRNVEATAEVTAATIDNLKFLRDGKADLALVLGPALHDAYLGAGRFARFGRVPANALAVLYEQPLHVVTLADRGIRSIEDLRGRVVSTGGPGSGTEDVAFRMLEAAGVSPSDGIRRQALGPAPAAEALRDGKLDAFIWSSGLPTAAILDLATTVGSRMRLLPSAHLLPALRARYGESLFRETIIPRGTYPGLGADVPTIGVTTLLVVDSRMSDDLVYEIARALFEHKRALVAVYAEARHLDPPFAAAGSPVPFHPGAIRYYREQQVWPGS